MRLIQSVALLLVLAGCQVDKINLGSQSDAGTAAPMSLTYAANPATYTVGQLASDNLPSSTGGAVTSYAIAPELPAGLSLDTETGVISGTPTVVSEATDYTVTAANAAGSTTATLTITVNDVAPEELAYFSNPATYTRGIAIPDNVPTSTGGTVVTYKITPALPAGLSLDATTGVITGTPTEPSSATHYTVTATNSGGSTTASLTITVNDEPPSELTYATNPAVYTLGVPITQNTPMSGNGVATSYEITPALPAGLSLDAETGIIFGTPTMVSPATAYTVSATNSGGTASTLLSIAVVDVPPSLLTYSTNPAVYTQGVPIADNVPSSIGGVVLAYSITPALPAGLQFDQTTGEISGTPTTLSPVMDYTVTATNTGGSTTTTLALAVVDVPSTGLSYATNPVVYTLGQPITNNAPTSSGGAVVSYAITPALPAGLSFETTTGVISGTPAQLAVQADYVVTATNSGGSTTSTLTITVNDVPPSALVYLSNPVVYTLGQRITDNVPTSSGGAVVSYAISKPLPTGLHFDPATGAVSGTPTALSPTTSYTVTATNTGGSTTATLTLTVIDVPPTNLSYTTNPATYTLGQLITDNVPTSHGGAVVSYAIAPALPTGLSFDPETGVISGTPTMLSPATTYTVTATNSGGTTTASLTIAVIDVPPSSLTYSTNPAIYTQGVTIANNVPSHSGGVVVSYAISPALPAGLSFDTTTGIISGTPTAISPTTSYTITATNSGGDTAVTLTITVHEPAPSNLKYSANPAVWIQGRTVTNDVPSSSGGAVVSYGITPALPGGLSFSTTTGVISGTPTVVSSMTSYTVTATNAGGSATVVLTIIVNPPAITGMTGVLTAGAEHTCAVVNGGARCWGRNENGPLGNNSTTNSVTPVVVSGLTTGVQAVAAGRYHTCALVNGGVQCWGWNIYGQLGNNSTTNSLVPVPVSGLTTGVQAIAAGNYHACALVNGGVQCWGNNSYGDLGNNSTDPSSVPVVVSGLTSGVQAIAAGWSHTCALVNGGVRCWGRNDIGQLGNNSTTSSQVPVAVSGLTSGVQAIAVGGDFSCALIDGGVRCWGSGANGKLGNNATADSTVPVAVSGLTSGVQSIAAGWDHACAVVNGGVQCWGLNFWGQLGNNSKVDSSVPVALPSLTGVQAIAAGQSHTCALVKGGLQCWGWGQYGQLGSNTTQTLVPKAVGGLTNGLQQIAMGALHSCAIVNGSARCWGRNDNGQLGNNATTDSPVPLAVAGLPSGVQSIAPGLEHTCAIVNGGVWCWGANERGQLGNNSTTDSLVPVAVPGLTSGVQSISSGAFQTCALVNGGVQCWGAMPEPTGAFSTNWITNLVPTAITGLTSGVQSVAAGTNHSCALVNGGVRCWGVNNYGQLGNNSTTKSLTPVSVTGLTSGVQSILSGNDFTFAQTNGGVRWWGANWDGQFGTTSLNYSPVQLQVTNLTSNTQTIALTPNNEHACALISGGVQCWGMNDNGQLGNNSTTQSSVPVASALTSGVQVIVAGGNHNCAIVDGGVQCWGDNPRGQLGNNSLTDSLVPVPTLLSF